ncbi:MAG: patatin-like phospholipase family protein [Spirochaetia bacterium]
MTPKIGLALGGGAARGFAHIGVLKVFEEERIPLAAVTGTSVGSLMGLLFCAGKTCREIEAVSLPIRWRDILSLRLSGRGIYCTDKLERLIEGVLGPVCFEDLEIPFTVLAVDVTTGEEVLLDSGPAAAAVCASTAVPGVFCPREIGGRLLIDGGMRNSVPADVVRRMGTDIVVGVDLNRDRVKRRSPTSALQVVSNTLGIILNNNLAACRRCADILIAPDLTGFGYRRLDDKGEMIRRGEEAMRDALPKLESMLGSKKT